MLLMKKKIPTKDEIQRHLEEIGDQRAEEVRRLKDDEGKTFQEIGDILGFSRQRAEQLYKRAKRKR